MSETYGNQLKLTIFGESHGAGIGCVIDGLPAGTVIDWDYVRAEMARRAPGNSNLATARKEKDAFEVLSGYFDGHTTGTALAMLIRNTSQHSADYDILKDVMRPGHADYTGRVRYGGWNDYRGGGHFSGRITAPLTFAGAIAREILEHKGISIGSHMLEIHGVPDRAFNPLGENPALFAKLRGMKLPTLEAAAAVEMEAEILRAKQGADSVGGVVECMAVGLPAGVGDPFFDSLESQLAHMLFSVPAVKGLEFGEGFAFAGLTGSEANDPMRYEGEKVVQTANHNGGLYGGITSGAPLLFRVAVKPTASIGKEQDTVNITTKENTKLSVRGRHDPCIVPRAIPVIENAAAFVLLDALLGDTG